MKIHLGGEYSRVIIVKKGKYIIKYNKSNVIITLSLLTLSVQAEDNTFTEKGKFKNYNEKTLEFQIIKQKKELLLFFCILTNLK